MLNIIKKINNLARLVFIQLKRKVLGVRVFYNSLLLYFDDGSTRFYSKNGEDWGAPDTMYFVTEGGFNKEDISTRMKEQFVLLAEWFEDWSNANLLKRVWLIGVYYARFGNPFLSSV